MLSVADVFSLSFALVRKASEAFSPSGSTEKPFCKASSPQKNKPTKGRDTGLFLKATRQAFPNDWTSLDISCCC